MPNLSDRVADLFSRTTPQPKENPSTVISHREVAESGSPISVSRVIIDAPADDIDMDDTPADQLASEVADAATPPKNSKKTTGKPQKSTATKAAAKPKLPPATKSTKATASSEIEWKGETGPDNAVANSEGEQEWEIARICKVEDSGKILVVQWKGWKGFWPEPYDDIKAQVPAMVKQFEKELKELNKEARKAGKRGAATNSVVQSKKPSSAAVGKSNATGVKRGRPPGSKKVAKPTPAAASKATEAPKTARQATSSRGRPAKVTKSPKKANGPKKATAAAAAAKSPAKSTALPKKATTSPKKVAAKGKASGSGVMAKPRGRPKKA